MLSASPAEAAASAADSRWADLPLDLLVRTFAAQPEPLHNLAAERVCRSWAHAVQETPVSHLTLLARSDAEALCHARLLARRPHADSVSLLRWAEWEHGDGEAQSLLQRLRLLHASRRDAASDAAMASLPQKLRCLLLGEFALSALSLHGVSRLTALCSLTLQTAGHAHFLDDLGAVRWHPTLAELTLHHTRDPEQSVTIAGNVLPHRLTSLHMQGLGSENDPMHVGDLLSGVANLKRLMLLGCWTYVDWPGPGWDRLRRLEQLEMTGGDGGVDDLSAVTPEPAREHELWRARVLRIGPESATLFPFTIDDVAGSDVMVVDIPASVEVLHLVSGGHVWMHASHVAPALSGSRLRELHIDLTTWKALPAFMDQLSGVEVHLKLSRELLDVPFSSMMAGWTNSICKQIVSLDLHQVALYTSLSELSSILSRFPRVCNAAFKSSSSDGKFTPAGLECQALGERPALRTLSIQHNTEALLDLSLCANLVALDLTVCQVTEAWAIPRLPRLLTALTLVAFAEGVSVLQPSLPQLSALRRLELQYSPLSQRDGCAALPELPVSLTHLTLGVHGGRSAGSSMLSSQPVPKLHGQDQLTRLTDLRELIVHAARPLGDMDALLRRLPLLVINYRAHKSRQGGCGLRYAAHSEGKAAASVFFPYGYDGHGYIP